MARMLSLPPGEVHSPGHCIHRVSLQSERRPATERPTDRRHHLVFQLRKLRQVPCVPAPPQGHEWGSGLGCGCGWGWPWTQSTQRVGSSQVGSLEDPCLSGVDAIKSDATKSDGAIVRPSDYQSQSIQQQKRTPVRGNKKPMAHRAHAGHIPHCRFVATLSYTEV